MTQWEEVLSYWSRKSYRPDKLRLGGSVTLKGESAKEHKISSRNLLIDFKPKIKKEMLKHVVKR